MITRLLVVLVAALGAIASGGAATAVGAGVDDEFLRGLQGDWEMVGTVRQRAARYDAHAEPALQGAFLHLHMIDVATPPAYEADVYIGFDAKQDDYVAHWLDRFGAAGARVTATGKRQGDRLVVTFPYAEGAFRDTLTRDGNGNAWTLLLEAQAPDGAWSTFASYRLTRRR